MARFTKQYKIDDYERLLAHADLLELYLYDTQTGRKPDAVEREGRGDDKVNVQLWRAVSASGGYVVIMGSTPNIFTLDDANRKFGEDHSTYTLAIRVCLERCTVARTKLLDAKYGLPMGVKANDYSYTA